MAEKEIRILRAEVRRLKRENEYLRGRLATLGEKPIVTDPISSRFGKGACMAAASHRITYGGYLLHRLRTSLAYRLFDRTRFAMRGVFLATKLRDLLLWVLFLLGFGTRFLLVAGLVAVLLPVLALVSLVLALLRFLAHRKWERALLGALAESGTQTIYLIFTGNGWEKRPYFRFMTDKMKESGMVFLITDSFAQTGFRGVKQRAPRCYTVHISYYFTLKKLLHGHIVQIY